MNSLLSCHRWISGRITQTFKRVICVIALYKGRLQQKTTNLSLVYMNAIHEIINHMPAELFMRCNLKSCLDLLQPHQSHPCTGRDSGSAALLQHRAGALQRDGRKIMVCASQCIK